MPNILIPLTFADILTFNTHRLPPRRIYTWPRVQKSHFDLSHCESPWWPFCHRYLPFVVTADTHEPTELIDPSGVTAFSHCFKILLLNRIICAQRIKARKCFCSLYPCPVLCNHTIDERLAKKGKKKPPTHGSSVSLADRTTWGVGFPHVH